MLSLSVVSAGASELGSWAFGINYGSVPNWESSFGLDLQLPSIYQNEDFSYGVVVDVDMRIAASTLIDETFLFSASLFMRRSLYKELVSSYMKIGVGYALVDERLHDDEGFIFVPFTFGVDLMTFDKDGQYGSFFAETGFNLDFLDEDVYARVHNGVFINLGLRIFF